MKMFSIVNIFCLICGAFAIPPQKQVDSSWEQFPEPEIHEHGNWQNQPRPECEGKMILAKLKTIY